MKFASVEFTPICSQGHVLLFLSIEPPFLSHDYFNCLDTDCTKVSKRIVCCEESFGWKYTFLNTSYKYGFLNISHITLSGKLFYLVMCYGFSVVAVITK